MSVIDDRSEVRAVHDTWQGRSGHQRMLETVPVRTADPVRFRAERRLLLVDGMQLVEWRSTPMTVVSAARPPGTPRSVRLTIVSAGRVRYSTDGELQDGGRGSVHFATDDEPIEIAFEEDSLAFAIIVPLSQLPEELRRATLPRPGRLERSTSTMGFVALLEHVMAESRHAAGPAVLTARAVRALAASLLLEHVEEPFVQDHDLRHRIVDHIEHNLADPGLGPRSIANEFGVSLRWVHRVFNVDGASIARFIRERRVDAVAERMRTDRHILRVGVLAHVYGFAGRDQLARAFRARYGMTTSEYLDLVQRGLPLPDADAADDPA